MKQRLAYIDIAKGVAIIAVVLLHIDYAFAKDGFLPLWSLLGNAWHVCVFFMLSGFFVTNERLFQPLTFLRGKIRSLYVPLIVIYTGVLLLHNTLIHIGFYQLGNNYGGKIMQFFSPTDFLYHWAEALLLAGREPILAPLWFVSVLLLAFLLLWLLSEALHRALPPNHSTKTFEWTRFILILTACVAAHLLSNVFGLNIPRCNNSFTALWLILCGYLIHQQFHLQFNSWRMVLICFPLFYFTTLLFGSNILITNTYHNVISLTLCSFSALYLICFFAKKIEQTWLGHVLSWLGQHSFSIMALHLLAFQTAIWLLRITAQPSSPQGVLNPVTDQSLLLLAYYTIMGVLLPALAATALSWLRRQIATFHGRLGCHHKQSDDSSHDLAPKP